MFDVRECSRSFILIKNECSRTFAKFLPPPKCPFLGGIHFSIKARPKILFPASTAAVRFGHCIALTPRCISVLNPSFLSSSHLRLAFKFIL